MAGTKEGSKKAKKTIIKRYGKDFYRNAGSRGGNPLLLEIRKNKQESRLAVT